MALHISSENNRALCGRISDDCLSQAFAEKVTCKTCAKIWGKIAVEPVPVAELHLPCPYPPVLGDGTVSKCDATAGHVHMCAIGHPEEGFVLETGMPESAMTDDGYAGTFEQRTALFEAALSIGYDRGGAGRVSEGAYWQGRDFRPYGDECAEHPAMRQTWRNGEPECEACEVLRQADEQADRKKLSTIVPANADVPARHYSGVVIIALAAHVGQRAVTVTLRAQDTAEVPGTTKRIFNGPGEIHYLVYPDGGLDVLSRDPSVMMGFKASQWETPAEDAPTVAEYLGFREPMVHDTDAEIHAAAVEAQEWSDAERTPVPVPSSGTSVPTFKREPLDPNTGHWARHYRHVATGPAEGRLFHTACGRKVNPFSQGPELPECSKCFPVEMSPTVAMDNTHRVAAEIVSERGTPTRGVGVADYASEPRRFRSRNGKRKVFAQRHRSHRRGW